jgi:hypothetical protein
MLLITALNELQRFKENGNINLFPKYLCKILGSAKDIFK